MRLVLAPLPDTLRGPDDEVYRGRVPRRARFLHPAAAGSLLRLVADYPFLVLTDVYRSPEASLVARRSKRGVQPPGFSAHNFGIAVDLDLGPTLRGGKIVYAELVELTRNAGWHCHRRDLDGTANEAWHFNYFGPDASRYLKHADPDINNTWAWPVEERILEMHAIDFALSDLEVQQALASMRLYLGDLDGRLGPLAVEAVRCFQRAWGLPDDGVAGPRTRRVLAVVSAERELVAPEGGPVA